MYESPVLQRFVGVDLGAAPAPDETTVCHFRHLLKKHDLCGMMLEAVNLHLEAKGIRIATGTIVAATILHAPSSTKNEKKERDPEMHQTKKGNQWYFGLKAHIGVDAKQRTVHSVATTAANMADFHMLPDLLHGEERKVWGGGYQGQTEAIQQAAPKAQDMTCKRTRFKQYVDPLQKKKNRSKSKVRAKVEHAFRILKRIFGFDKVRYRGDREEPRPAVRLLRSDQSLSPPQTSGRTCVELRLNSANQTSTANHLHQEALAATASDPICIASAKLSTCTELP